jgi:hypothetical protein
VVTRKEIDWQEYMQIYELLSAISDFQSLLMQHFVAGVKPPFIMFPPCP